MKLRGPTPAAPAKWRRVLRQLLAMGLPDRERDRLDDVLFRWSDKDLFTVRDLLNGGVLILGRTGSGKTSGSGRRLGEAIVTYPGSSGLILCAKPEDKEMWRRIFASAKRPGDLKVFEPGPASDLRFNFLDYVVRMGGDTREITKCITSIGETLQAKGGTGWGGDKFWPIEQGRMIYNAVEIVKLATGRVTAPDLQQFIATAPNTPDEIQTAGYQSTFHWQCMDRAFRAEKSVVSAHDYELAETYWMREIPRMADRTKSSILASVMGVLHVANTGICRELTSTETNISPEDMLESGVWVLVNMPAAQWGDSGTFVNAGWKYLTQLRVLRRNVAPGDRINVIWADESSQVVQEFDATYAEQGRSHLGCMVYLSQSLHSYYRALPGEAGRHQVDALLTNFQHKIVHALGDVDTAQYASGLIGRELQTFIGGSIAPQEDLWNTVLGNTRFGGNFSQHYEDVLQSNVFMNGLRTGGKANRFLCDSIIVRSGEPFTSGLNWLWAVFKQR